MSIMSIFEKTMDKWEYNQIQRNIALDKKYGYGHALENAAVVYDGGKTKLWIDGNDIKARYWANRRGFIEGLGV